VSRARHRPGRADARSRLKPSPAAQVALIDPQLGGISQVSLKPDWSAPSREYPMFAQQAALSAYARAAVLFDAAHPRAAADRLFGFLKNTLASPDGGFYASMGMAEGEPGVDKRQYARETGQAIQGLVAYYDATGEKSALSLAVAAARWALSEPGLPDGGFRHAERDAAGPYLADNVEMAAALLALHRSTADRQWLADAVATADFIARTFIDRNTGGFLASSSPDGPHLPKPIK